MSDKPKTLSDLLDQALEAEPGPDSDWFKTADQKRKLLEDLYKAIAQQIDAAAKA